ncbi:MAG: AMP-binding protein, partial [Desulfovibrionales bacterium]
MIQDEINRVWLQSYDKNVPESLHFETIPIFAYLDRAAEKNPKRTALVFNNWKVSYSKLKSLVETVSANLQKQGLNRGDRVAVMLPNTPQAVIAYWAILKAGGIVVMTNPLYMEKELVHHFNDSGAKFLITIDLLWPKLSPLLSKFNLSKIFVTRISDTLRFPVNHLYRFKAHREGTAPQVPFDENKIRPWKDLLSKGARLKEFRPNPDHDL